MVDAQVGVVLDPGKATLGEYLEDWLASVARSLKPTTLEGYAHSARVWIIPRIGVRPRRKLLVGSEGQLITE